MISNLEFDKIIYREVCGTQIGYGFCYGTKKNIVLFVKVGRNGSIFGYRNKYLKMVNYIASEHGITVIVSSNTYGGYKWDAHMVDATEMLETYFEDNEIDESKRMVLYFGHSDGASMAALHGKEHEIFDAFLLSNLPLPAIKDENHTDEVCNEAIKILLSMSTINDSRQLILVYGEKDKGYETYKRIETKLLLDYGQIYEVHVIKNEAHHISEPVVMVIPELFFDDNVLIDKGLELDFEESII